MDDSFTGLPLNLGTYAFGSSFTVSMSQFAFWQKSFGLRHFAILWEEATDMRYSSRIYQQLSLVAKEEVENNFGFYCALLPKEKKVFVSFLFFL